MFTALAIAVFRASMLSSSELPEIRGVLEANQPRDAATIEAAQPLDLTGSYQTRASQFDKITTFPWRVVPRGSQTLGNVPLAIDGMLCLWGEGNAKNGAVFPEKVERYPCGSQVRYIIRLSCVILFLARRLAGLPPHAELCGRNVIDDDDMLWCARAGLVSDSGRTSQRIDRFEVENGLACR